MLRKTLFAVTLAVPAVAISAPAHAETYQSGPKPATVRNVPSQAKTFEPNRPYAQDLEKRKGKHLYQGGPRSTIPHANH